jgi:superfamily II DNA or RNA helicase
MNTDTTFITNEGQITLKERFKTLIKDTRLFDVLVGYFYPSGFYAIYEALEQTEKIRILVGIGTNKQVLDLIQESKSQYQIPFQFSHAEIQEKLSPMVIEEMDQSEDSSHVERGIKKFIEWLVTGKLEIKAYPSEKIHAKLYIMTFKKGDKDTGRIITGSSNFTQSGLVENLEFNVELKDKADYKFALDKFNELWLNAVDVKDTFLEAIVKRSWANDSITPYEMYLKFLYEYFKGRISYDQDADSLPYQPEGFMDLKYQREAVNDAKARLEEYGGGFLADVVGLGKTYIAGMLASQLSGRNLVLAPPGLIDTEDPCSWREVFRGFNIAAKFVSIGKLESLASKDTSNYANIFIDEAHRFRNESNLTYEKLAQICRGKRVILVSATPLNNTPQDIFNQIKLFQKTRKSTIPNQPDLERFFGNLTKRLKGLDRQKDYDEYIQIVSENAKEIREKILKYLMVRRTRSEITNYYRDDLMQQGLKFPEVADPEPVLYQLNADEEAVFNSTLRSISAFTYSRYTPLLHLKKALTQPDQLAQMNMLKFMKILLVKRLESSYHAFRLTIGRFIKSYEQFLKTFDAGKVYISKKYTARLFEALESDDDEVIQKLVDEDKAHEYDADDFEPDFRDLLVKDLNVLKDIDARWKNIKRDPKLLKLGEILNSDPMLKHNKLIIFTESRETADYLDTNLSKIYPNNVLVFSGFSDKAARQEVIANFDAHAKPGRDDVRILVTTEVLAEGVNLHRSNVVINYDIPWNPARLMQRVGRINRVDTKFEKIYTYTFFPTTQSNDQIKLEESAITKIQAFIEMLGSDARLLTDGEEIKSHDLFSRLNSKKSLTGEDETAESELEYLQVIRKLRDENPELFDKIKKLPRKARTGRRVKNEENRLLTYFRKGKLQKFFLCGKEKPDELDFLAAAKILQAEPSTPRKNPGTDYFDFLAKNKEAFQVATTFEVPESKTSGGRSSIDYLIKLLKTRDFRLFKGFTEEDEDFIAKLGQLLAEGGLPKQTAKNAAELIKAENNPLKILAILRKKIPTEFFKDTVSESAAQTAGPREVILSEYLSS